MKHRIEIARPKGKLCGNSYLTINAVRLAAVALDLAAGIAVLCPFELHFAVGIGRSTPQSWLYRFAQQLGSLVYYGAY